MTRTPSPLDKHIGLRIKMRRILLNITQDTLAQQLNITFQQLQKYEKAINRISASRLYEIARILEIDISYFFEGFYDDTSNIMKESNIIQPQTYQKKPKIKLSQKTVIQTLISMPSGNDKKQLFDMIKLRLKTLDVVLRG